jgi:hypothetical protein
MTRILVFGDSISYGAWDEEGGWASHFPLSKLSPIKFLKS